MIDKILYYILAFTLGFVIMFCTLVIQKKDNQIRDLKNRMSLAREIHQGLVYDLQNCLNK